MKKNIYAFVLDCSITMAWCFEDESNDQSDKILESLRNATAVVPNIWSLEISNVLLQAKKKKRINDFQVASFIDALSALPIIIDASTSTRAMHSIFLLANKTNLTIYDAAYLELALRENIPLVTLDKDLIRAARELDVSLTLI